MDTERGRDLDDVMTRMSDSDDRYRYSVAWLDVLASGSALGRGVLIRGDHAGVDDLPRQERSQPLRYREPRTVPLPRWVPNGVLRPLTVGAFNQWWYRRAPRLERGRLETIPQFFHPLDGVAGWNRLYGRSGFVQYQLVVPFGAEATIRQVVERFSQARSPSFLTVLKRFGEGNPGPLSFPIPGWTLSLDLPADSRELGPLLDELDDEVVAAGGRVYLAKDSRLRPRHLRSMYPRLDEWWAVRDRLDPDRRFVSDQARRLGLVA